jgi:hypothetical protein
VQVPTFPATSQAAHWSVHPVSQHTPSTQCPLAHWRSSVHAAAIALLSMHAPPLHQRPPRHAVSTAQLVAHVPAMHTYDPHDVRPPWGGPPTLEQVPFEPATSQASHCPVHARSQHTPSTQNPEAHSAFEVHVAPNA